MRILFFHFGVLGHLGGVEVAVLRLAQVFTERGNPSAIVEIARDRQPRRLLSNGIPVWGVTAPSVPALRRPRSWASFARATTQFLGILAEFRPDIVHVHFPLSQCLPVCGAATFPHRWKLVVTVHNSDIRISPFETPYIKTWQARLFRRADALTAVSSSLLDDTMALYGDLRHKAQVIHNGVGPQWLELPFSSDGKADYVLFVGRLHPVKGVDLLLPAWKSVCSSSPNTQLWIAGDGDDRASLEKLSKDLGIASRVRFLGPKTQQELPELYRNARVVVLPSRREGLPISLLEAGACGAICIGTRIPGIEEIIEEEVTGFLVPPESTEQLADALLRSLQLPPERAHEMQKAARARIAGEFSEERMIQRYMDLYEAL